MADNDALQVGQLVVWSSSVDQRTADRPAHRACYRLPSSADRVGDVHPAVLFGMSGFGMAMEGAPDQRWEGNKDASGMLEDASSQSATRFCRFVSISWILLDNIDGR